MIYLRRVSQVLFLGLFIVLISLTREPLSENIPVNLFFISDPLVVLCTILASGTVQILFIASLVIVVISVFLGRVFCGWACPLGTSIDIFNRFKKPKPENKLPLSFYKIKYLILVFIIVMALIGVNVVGFFDPITIVFKAFGLSLYSTSSKSVLFHNSIIFFGLFIVILLATLYQTRFWCRLLCPLGALLGILSKWRLLRLSINQNCTGCGDCSAICKTGAISDDLKLHNEECIQCYTCVKKCLVGGVEINFKRSTITSIAVLPERRALLITAGLGILSAPLLKHSFSLKRRYALPRLRPPGALLINAENEFLAKCIRCGECMKVCPTNGLQPLLFGSGLYALWSPVIVPRIGYCRYYCNACGKTCPTGAIPNLPLEEKQEYKIGLAYFDTTRCIPYVHKENCLTCEEYCQVPEKAIEHYEKDGIKYPYIVKERCIGCGLCENVCPVQGIAAIRVYQIN
jgi:polyferredoxin